MRLPRLLVLTDRHLLPRGRSLVSTLAECRPHGLTHVMLRELDLPDADRAELARRLTDAGLAVIAAHRPLPTCVGVHLPAGARRPRHELWSRSCHSPDDVLLAQRDGARWATLSPFAASTSKPGYGPPLDPSAFDGHGIPVVALGGIDAANAADAITAGAQGVAVMGAVMRAHDPAQVVAELLGAVA